MVKIAEPWRWLKFLYYKPFDYPNGTYRVGPLARVNICDYIETPLAGLEQRLFATVRQIALHFIDGDEGKTSVGILNRIEAGIRSYGLCLSCSASALGRMAMHFEIISNHCKLIGILIR